MPSCWLQHRSGQSVNHKRAQLVTDFMKLYVVLGPSQRAIAGENTSRITVSG